MVDLARGRCPGYLAGSPGHRQGNNWFDLIVIAFPAQFQIFFAAPTSVHLDVIKLFIRVDTT
jgi:hypothetical protein